MGDKQENVDKKGKEEESKGASTAQEPEHEHVDEIKKEESKEAATAQDPEHELVDPIREEPEVDLGLLATCLFFFTFIALLLDSIILKLFTPLFGCVFALDGHSTCRQSALALVSILLSPIVLYEKGRYSKNVDELLEPLSLLLVTLCTMMAWIMPTFTPFHQYISLHYPEPSNGAIAAGMVLSIPLALTGIGAARSLIYILSTNGIYSRSSYYVIIASLVSAGISYVLLETFGTSWSLCRVIVTVTVGVQLFTQMLNKVIDRRSILGFLLLLLLVGGIGTSVTFIPSCHDCSSDGTDFTEWNTDRFLLVDRKSSTTGIISVIDDLQEGLRLMKADHSLLGGRYNDTEQSSIYSIFHVHEAVRLARPEGTRFLQIGLGVGIVASAMQAHNVTVDVVEVDPAVVTFAHKYFGFNKEYRKGHVYTEDALVWINGANAQGEQYDWIVHDVFTGGSLAGDLFTFEFFTDIKAHLTPNGILAVNYVGYVSGDNSTDTVIVVNTLRSIFPYLRCIQDDQEGDLRNFVIFVSDTPIKFRKPVIE
eukprot:Ihof_evm4s187 gene=Ihof_evmTU4s187